MVWVEQPVGVGFTQGTPNITDEVELAQQFAGFYKQFSKAFGLQNRKIYIAGESYAGFYVPYVADAFIQKNDSTYYNLAGLSIIDPIIGNEVLQQAGKQFSFGECNTINEQHRCLQYFDE